MPSPGGPGGRPARGRDEEDDRQCIEAVEPRRRSAGQPASKAAPAEVEHRGRDRDHEDRGQDRPEGGAVRRGREPPERGARAPAPTRPSAMDWRITRSSAPAMAAAESRSPDPPDPGPAGALSAGPEGRIGRFVKAPRRRGGQVQSTGCAAPESARRRPASDAPRTRIRSSCVARPASSPHSFVIFRRAWTSSSATPARR